MLKIREQIDAEIDKFDIETDVFMKPFTVSAIGNSVKRKEMRS